MTSTKVVCSVNECKNSDLSVRLKAKELSFFTVPQDQGLLNKWNAESNYTWQSGMKICSEHFADEDFVNLGTSKRKILRKGAIPFVSPTEYLEEEVEEVESFDDMFEEVPNDEEPEKLNPPIAQQQQSQQQQQQPPQQQQTLQKKRKTETENGEDSSVVSVSKNPKLDNGDLNENNPDAVNVKSVGENPKFINQFLGFVKKENSPSPKSIISNSKPPQKIEKKSIKSSPVTTPQLYPQKSQKQSPAAVQKKKPEQHESENELDEEDDDDASSTDEDDDDDDDDEDVDDDDDIYSSVNEDDDETVIDKRTTRKTKPESIPQQLPPTVTTVGNNKSDSNEFLVNLNTKIDRMESSLTKLLDDLRKIRDDIADKTSNNLNNKTTNKSEAIKKPIPTTPPTIPNLNNKNKSLSAASSNNVEQKSSSQIVRKKKSPIIDQTTSKISSSEQIKEIPSCFPIGAADFIKLNKICNENVNMRQFVIKRFNSCNEKDLNKFVTLNLKNILTEVGGKTLSWKNLNSGYVPMKNCIIIKMLIGCTLRKIPQSTEARIYPPIKQYFKD